MPKLPECDRIHSICPGTTIVDFEFIGNLPAIIDAVQLTRGQIN